METIVSRDNRQVRLIRRLLSDAKYRRSTGLFVAEGARLCADAAASGVSIHQVLVTPHAAEAYAGTVETLLAAGQQSAFITEELARHMGDTLSPQGIFCVCQGLDNPAGLDTIKKNGRFLALENMQDPSNLGAVIRTAEALGIDGLLVSTGCCDRYNPKVMRASMGGVFRLPLIEAGSMAGALACLQDQGMTAYACGVDPAARPVQKVRFLPGSIAVIGNEGNGLTPQTVQACRERITIRMAGRAESLNASVAASLVAWEMTRSLPECGAGD